ncbi:MAG: sigma-70 family RNA polymerase sigma factor [Myxococcales bacterium]|nr:sigma-70 family RNA polymerase sigma factor [Myxococcales bacterium]
MSALRMLSPDRTSLVAQAPCIREIVLSHGRYVWRLLRYLGVAERDLDDVCQDVFTTVHRKLGDLADEGLRPWLRTICVNHAKNYRRRARHHREMLVDEMPEPVVSASQEEGLELAEAQRCLLTLLDRLDEDWRAIFVLHRVEDLPMEQVAKIVGCSLSTAYLRYQRACAGLENALVNT